MKWKDNELSFLRENYIKYGRTYCAEKLNRSKESVQAKAKRLGLKYDRSYIYKSNKFDEIVKSSKSYSEVCKKLFLPTYYGNRQTAKKHIQLKGLDISHFYSGDIGSLGKKIDLENILVENSKYTYTTHLKERLYKEGIKEKVCELCGQDENWKSGKLVHILDHINGISNDNRIENLRIVCPNCNSNLVTNGGKNININTNSNFYIRRIKESISKLYFCECGKKIRKQSKVCLECSQRKQRKVKDRPSYDQLMQDIRETNYTQTGKKYGVSDNTIRKWLKLAANNK